MTINNCDQKLAVICMVSTCKSLTIVRRKIDVKLITDYNIQKSITLFVRYRCLVMYTILNTTHKYFIREKRKMQQIMITTTQNVNKLT